MKLFTIGFTKKSAEEFFARLQDAGVRRVVDVRLNNTSQIAGFAKARDLEFFLRAVAGIAYLHLPDLAPTSYYILHNHRKYVTIEEMKQKPFPKRTTLQLVRVDDFTVRDARSPATEKHNWKGVLLSGERTLELTITDPAFCAKLNKGYIPSRSCLLTMSLSMPYKPPEWKEDEPPVCWKLIAGIIEL